MLDLRRLRLLRELSERGTIAAVADALQYTPSAVSLQLALPAMETLARDAPRLRCEAVEAEPEDALPALALGDLDLVIGDEWQHQPVRLPRGVERHELHRDPVYVVLPARHPAARRHRGTVPLAELAGDV